MADIVRLLPFFFFLSQIAAEACGSSPCAAGGPSIRSPFRLVDKQPLDCGYSSYFDLSCNNLKQTILSLPSSGDFIIERISYANQYIWISDPDNCLIKRFIDNKFSLLESPFRYLDQLQSYTFYNCTSQPAVPQWSPISCLSNGNYDVIGVSDWSTISPSPLCHEITTAMVPAESNELGNYDFDLMMLIWNVPDCRFCELSGKVCGFQNGSHSELDCSSSSGTRSYGLSKAAKYGIAIGLLIPGLLSITCCALCLSASSSDRGLPESTTELSDTVANLQPQVIVGGLDGLTIESYPKTQLGESLELPDPNENTCPICLGEYQPKETLRAIPKCNHYFHANCIDEWLRTNPTCPLCRNLPGLSSC